MTDIVHATVIDPQHDFCHPDGSLSVPGAYAAMVAMANFIVKCVKALSEACVSQDSHHPLHIANPGMVVDREGNHPDTRLPHHGGNGPLMITLAEAEAGDYRCAFPGLQAMWIGYLRALAANDKYPYVVWPEHCIIGTPGHAFIPEISAALDIWGKHHGAVPEIVPKGSSPYTEHYSVMQADVPDPDDDTTGLNEGLVESMGTATRRYWGGIAGSHCLANTVLDAAAAFGDDYDFGQWAWLEDCTAPVPDFEHLQEKAMAEMKGKGMQFMTTTDALKEMGL